MTIPTHFKSKSIDIFEVELTTDSPLHIGSGQESDTGMDKNIQGIITTPIRGNDTSFIPGTSLKGVLRSTIERMLRSSNDYTACDPFSNNRCSNSYKDNMGYWSHEKIHEKLSLRRKGQKSGLCLACILFGSGAMRSIVEIEDFIPPKGETPPILVKTSTAITRDNGGAVSGSLHSVEYIPAGVTYRGRITIKSENQDLIGYVAAALNQMNLGMVTVGAFSSKGFGRMKCEITRRITNEGFETKNDVNVENTSKLLKELINGIGDGSW